MASLVVVVVGSMTACGGATNPPASTDSRSEAELTRRIDAVLQKAVAADEFSGAVLVTHEGEFLYRTLLLAS
jgi:hypothetical protein